MNPASSEYACIHKYGIPINELCVVESLSDDGSMVNAYEIIRTKNHLILRKKYLTVFCYCKSTWRLIYSITLQTWAKSLGELWVNDSKFK